MGYLSGRLREEKSRRMSKKGLTCEMKIDNLEKFAKTSLVAEVILDGPKRAGKKYDEGSK
jgi:hypothetical protein